jgi:hypothetical protein
VPERRRTARTCTSRSAANCRPSTSPISPPSVAQSTTGAQRGNHAGLPHTLPAGVHVQLRPGHPLLDGHGQNWSRRKHHHPIGHDQSLYPQSHRVPPGGTHRSRNGHRPGRFHRHVRGNVRGNRYLRLEVTVMVIIVLIGLAACGGSAYLVLNRELAGSRHRNHVISVVLLAVAFTILAVGLIFAVIRLVST